MLTRCSSWLRGDAPDPGSASSLGSQENALLTFQSRHTSRDVRTATITWVVMLKKPLGRLGIFLILVGIGYFIGAGVAYSKVQGGYTALQSFSEVQNVELSYNDQGQLTDR